MQDPIRAMKICGDINGYSSVIECARNSARLGNMSTATWLIPSIHNLRQTQASLYRARHDEWSE